MHSLSGPVTDGSERTTEQSPVLLHTPREQRDGGGVLRCLARIRHRQSLVPCTVRTDASSAAHDSVDAAAAAATATAASREKSTGRRRQDDNLEHRRTVDAENSGSSAKDTVAQGAVECVDKDSDTGHAGGGGCEGGFSGDDRSQEYARMAVERMSDDGVLEEQRRDGTGLDQSRYRKFDDDQRRQRWGQHTHGEQHQRRHSFAGEENPAGEMLLRVVFEDAPLKAVAPGQVVALYKDSVCLGGGPILRAEDSCQPVRFLGPSLPDGDRHGRALTGPELSQPRLV